MKAYLNKHTPKGLYQNNMYNNIDFIHHNNKKGNRVIMCNNMVW